MLPAPAWKSQWAMGVFVPRRARHQQTSPFPDCPPQHPCSLYLLHSNQQLRRDRQRGGEEGVCAVGKMLRSTPRVAKYFHTPRLSFRRLHLDRAPSEQPPAPSQQEAEAHGHNAPHAVEKRGDAVHPPPQSPNPRRMGFARAQDGGVLYTALALLLATPVVTYYYYQHRKQHMQDKKHRLLKEAQERYKAGLRG